MIGVDKQADPRANRRSDDAEAFDVVGKAEQADFDLQELEAGVRVA